MGNMYGTVYRLGRETEVGYGVPDTCNRPGCAKAINRGQAYLCGAVHGGDEYGCGFYFCEDDLYFPSERLGEPIVQGLCSKCWDHWFKRDWRVDA